MLYTPNFGYFLKIYLLFWKLEKSILSFPNIGKYILVYSRKTPKPIAYKCLFGQELAQISPFLPLSGYIINRYLYICVRIFLYKHFPCLCVHCTVSIQIREVSLQILPMGVFHLLHVKNHLYNIQSRLWGSLLVHCTNMNVCQTFGGFWNSPYNFRTVQNCDKFQLYQC